jgi:hypothetical protein
MLLNFVVRYMNYTTIVDESAHDSTLFTGQLGQLGFLDKRNAIKLS